MYFKIKHRKLHKKTKMATPEYIVREVVESDKAGVRGEISKNMYEGLDYTCADLDKWFAEETRRSWVVVDSATGEVVGFESLRVVDEGRTGIPQGLRVHPKARGKGISKLLSNAIRTFFDSDPVLQRFRVTARGDNELSVKIHEKQGLSVSCIQGVACLLAPSFTEFIPVSPQPSYAPLLPQEQWAGSALLTNPETVYNTLVEGDYLKESNGVLFHEWNGFEMRPGAEGRRVGIWNVEYLMREMDVVFEHHPEDGVFLMYTLRAYQRGLCLVMSVLTLGNSEKVVEYGAPILRKMLPLGMQSAKVFYDGSLYKGCGTGGGDEPHVNRLADEAGMRTDVDGFDLTSAGLIALEGEGKPLEA